MSDNKKALLIFIAMGATAALVGYGIWHLEKKINYNLQYKDMVRETVKEMVKPEALKN